MKILPSSGFLPFLLTFLVATAGCRHPDPADEYRDFALERTQRIILEEPDSAPIAGINSARLLPDGRVLVVDQQLATLRLHDGAGALIRAFGQPGDGPGEFRTLIDVARDSLGMTYAVDLNAGAVRVFDSSFRSTRSIPIPGGVGRSIDVMDEGLLVGARIDGENRFAILPSDPSRSPVLVHGWSGHAASAPYWSSVLFDFATQIGEHIVTASSLEYPLHIYDLDGAKMGTMGQPPESWREPRVPEPNEFGNRIEEAQGWLGELTFISGLGSVGDSLVVVSHGEFGAARGDRSNLSKVFHLSFDVYHAPSWKKLASGIPLPAGFLRIDADRFVAVESRPPEGPWVLGIYELVDIRP